MLPNPYYGRYQEAIKIFLQEVTKIKGKRATVTDFWAGCQKELNPECETWSWRGKPLIIISWGSGEMVVDICNKIP
jgi:hypothetical protein